jgi:hypothetical protein
VANSLFDSGRQAFLLGSIAGASQGWLGATVKWMLVGSWGGFSLTTNVFKSDVPNAQIIAVSSYVPAKTAAAGVADGGAAVFAGVTNAATAVYAMLFHDTGASNTSLLILADDTASILPARFDTGLDVTITPDTGANKIFKL